MTRKRAQRESYIVALPDGRDCVVLETRREDGASKLVAQPPKDREESPFERLERHALQAVENNLISGIVDCLDGDYIVPSAWVMPDGRRPDHPYEVCFTAYEMSCTCDYGEIAHGSPCAHLGAVYAMMLFNREHYSAILAEVRRRYGRVEVEAAPPEPFVDVVTLFTRVRSDSLRELIAGQHTSRSDAARAFSELYGDGVSL